jgi:competence protein CoiA
MKFSLVNGEKVQAQSGLRGICANCQSDTIAKCGNERIKHWAHKSNVSCDPWWENETEWHRAWKNHFPAEWQESIHVDPATGEKHIADIKTADGIVIEFQHSAIQPIEVKSREAFYKKIVWVVDGTRLKRDFPRFCKGSNEFESRLGSKDVNSQMGKDIFYTYFPEECFPKQWLTSSVPVYFDFQGVAYSDQPNVKRDALWCLFPGDVNGWAMVANVSRQKFIEFSMKSPHLLLAQDICERNQQRLAEEKHELEAQEWREKHQRKVDVLEALRRPVRWRSL